MFITGYLYHSSPTLVSGKLEFENCTDCTVCEWVLLTMCIFQVGTTATVPFVSVFTQLSSTVILPLLLGQVDISFCLSLSLSLCSTNWPVIRWCGEGWRTGWRNSLLHLAPSVAVCFSSSYTPLSVIPLAVSSESPCFSERFQFSIEQVIAVSREEWLLLIGLLGQEKMLAPCPTVTGSLNRHLDWDAQCKITRLQKVPSLPEKAVSTPLVRWLW